MMEGKRALVRGWNRDDGREEGSGERNGTEMMEGKRALVRGMEQRLWKKTMALVRKQRNIDYGRRIW